jgi:hypothetical protein
MIGEEKPKYTLGEDLGLDETEILDKKGRRLTNEKASQIANKVIERLSGPSK